jgi:hypothetical protein
MSAQQLRADGFSAAGMVVRTIDVEPGCRFKGTGVDVTFFKNQTQTVASYQKNGRWDDLTTTTVNGRSAARAQGEGPEGRGCAYLLDAGGGVVTVLATSPTTPDGRLCDDALQYARQIEPHLPQ